MKHVFAMLIISAALACAELSPEDFDEVRHAALNYGFYYAGTSQVRGATFYTFCNEKDGLVAFVPMIVSTVREAKAALSASLASYLVCADRWKRPLDQLLRETKSHLDELSDGTVVAVPEGFVLETQRRQLRRKPRKHSE